MTAVTIVDFQKFEILTVQSAVGARYASRAAAVSTVQSRLIFTPFKQNIFWLQRVRWKRLSKYIKTCPCEYMPIKIEKLFTFADVTTKSSVFFFGGGAL